MNVFLYIIFITILFTIYVEYSVGGILLRQNSLGKSSPHFYSLASYLINPLYNKFLWNPTLLDVNYIFVLCVSLFYINYCEKTISKFIKSNSS
jgi:hypothetical protein